jgi:hypothetical protein
LNVPVRVWLRGNLLTQVTGNLLTQITGNLLTQIALEFCDSGAVFEQGTYFGSRKTPEMWMIFSEKLTGKKAENAGVFTAG